MSTFSESENPLRSDSPAVWNRLIEAASPASLLVIIESRLGPLLRSRLEPQDILQEALLHAWRDRDKFEWRGHRHFRAWLVRLIDNRIHDAADVATADKRGGSRATSSLDGSLATNGGASAHSPFVPAALVATTTPSRVAVYHEEATAMRAALGSLPQDLHEIVRLRLIEQLTIEEIAARLSLGEAAVRRRFRKGVELYSQHMTAAMASRKSMADFAPESPLHSSPTQ